MGKGHAEEKSHALAKKANAFGLSTKADRSFAALALERAIVHLAERSGDPKGLPKGPAEVALDGHLIENQRWATYKRLRAVEPYRSNGSLARAETSVGSTVG